MDGYRLAQFCDLQMRSPRYSLTNGVLHFCSQQQSLQANMFHAVASIAKKRLFSPEPLPRSKKAKTALIPPIPKRVTFATRDEIIGDDTAPLAGTTTTSQQFDGSISPRTGTSSHAVDASGDGVSFDSLSSGLDSCSFATCDMSAGEPATCVTMDSDSTVVTQFEALEPQLRLLRDQLVRYAQPKDYNSGFASLSGIITRYRDGVVSRTMSSKLALLNVVTNMFSMMEIHKQQKEEDEETGGDEFDDLLFSRIVVSLCNLTAGAMCFESTHKNALRFADENAITCGDSFYESTELDMADQYIMEGVDEGLFQQNAEVAVADDGMDNLKMPALCDAASGDTTETDCSTCECDVCTADDDSVESTEEESKERAKEVLAYNKIVEQHNLAIMVLPDRLKEKTLEFIMDNRKKVRNGLCSGKDAWKKVQDVMGLKSDQEIARIVDA